MKPGSLVECVKSLWSTTTVQPVSGKHPAPTDILTIRGIKKDPIDRDFVLTFEEVVNDINPHVGLEYGYELECFREIQPPMDLTELIEEAIKQPVTA